MINLKRNTSSFHILIAVFFYAINCHAYQCNTLSVTVTAKTPNGGIAKNAVFNWSFNSGGRNAECGQFANGDYWIAPANNQNDVTITAITTTSAGNISADVDPVMETIGLLDGSNNYGNYAPQENIIPNLPISYKGINSIVAAIQRNENVEGTCGTKNIRGECVDAYNVVTILPFVPANAGRDMIRPNITGENKTLLTLNDFDFSRIPSKQYLTGTDASGYESIRQRWSHSTEIFGLLSGTDSIYSEGGRAFRSHILIDDYAAGVASTWISDMMIMFSDDNSLAEKQSALAAMLSYGLDLYHAVYDTPEAVTRHWYQGAGQHVGKFLPTVFLAALLTDSSYANKLKQETSNINAIYGNDYGPHELGQIHKGVNRPVWGDFTEYKGTYFHGAYWNSLVKSQCYDNATGICNPSIGKKNQLDPYGYVDGPPNKPGAGYMPIALGIQRGIVATMHLMPEIWEIINYKSIVDYVLRIDQYGIITNDDECVTPDTREDFGKCDPYRNKGCIYYGVTWGPTDPTNMQSDCIKTETPPYTKVGRFSNLHGTPVIPVYTIKQVENNWFKIVDKNYQSNNYAPVIKNIKKL